MRLLNHITTGKVIRLVQQSSQNTVVLEDEHFRWLTFDSIIQSVMLKRAPNKLLIPHQQALMIPLLFLTPKRIFELGLGGGNFSRSIKQLLPQAQLTTAEINPVVVELFNEFFNPDAHSFDIKIMNGEQLIGDQGDQADWIVCDIYGSTKHSYLLKIKEAIAHPEHHATWSINLPDLPASDIDQLLKELKAIVVSSSPNGAPKYHISYLEIPQFKNVVIYLVPTPFKTLLKQQSALPGFLFNKLAASWQYRKTIL